MMIIAEKMSMKGTCILTPIYPALINFERTEKQLENLKNAHLKRIEMSDAILVVDVDNYIGNSTKKEIEYARKLNKEVMYYTELIDV